MELSNQWQHQFVNASFEAVNYEKLSVSFFHDDLKSTKQRVSGKLVARHDQPSPRRRDISEHFH